jgi:phage baseplate assembly protein W
MSYLAFPYAVAPTGRTATVDWARHVEDMVELVVLTALGERVNLADFGSNAPSLVFEAPNEELISTSLYLVRAAVTQWLSDVLTLVDISVSMANGPLEIAVTYQLGLEPNPVVQVIQAPDAA